MRDGLHVDWHCHSRWSDGSGDVAEMVAHAEARGVTLGISDHALVDNPRLRTERQVAAYLADLACYPVLRGLEISVGDLGPYEVDLGQLDYVIASLHVVAVAEGAVHSSRYLNWRAGLYPLYRPTVARYDRRGFFERWLEALAATFERWPVTILGHFCLLPELAGVAGGCRLAGDPEPDDAALEWLDATVRLCVDHGVAIEMNSKSRVPHPAFIRRALELGARFSLGSDAHQRRRAGDLSYGRNLVEQLGLPPDRLLGVAAGLEASAARRTPAA